MLSYLTIRSCFHEVRKICTQIVCNFHSLPSLRENRDELLHSNKLFAIRSGKHVVKFCLVFRYSFTYIILIYYNVLFDSVICTTKMGAKAI